MDKYASYYSVLEELAPNGKTKKHVTYNGPYYSFSIDDAAYKKLKATYTAFVGLMLLCYLAIALIGASSLGAGRTPALYTSLPYVLLIFPLGMCVGKVFLFLFLPSRLEFPSYDKYVVHLKTYSVILLTLSIITLLGQLIYLILTPSAPVADIMFAVLSAVLSCVSVCFLRVQHKYICTPGQ